MSRLNASSSGNSSTDDEKFISELPPKQRQQLRDHLDALNVWERLAIYVELKPQDVQYIRRQAAQGNSPTDEFIKIWGIQYNHTVNDLFGVFQHNGLREAMRIIKDFVHPKYRLLIPKSGPALSVLLQQQNSIADGIESKKKSNNTSSSGVSNSNNVSTSDNGDSTSVSDGPTSADLSARNVKKYCSEINQISYNELTQATNNWNDQNILGRGGFGTVYRGYWKHTEVAIKQINYRTADERDSMKVQLQQSLNELKCLNAFRHDNVLPLYGYSLTGGKPCLVYQLMHGGTLYQRLHSSKFPPLTCKQRMNISIGTARGINYLHTLLDDKPLIHGDIKPANVLLDQCLMPKIGDFGLAREGPNTQSSALQVSRVYGTKPYLPPEFLFSNKLSTLVDTYSFGVMLLEICTGLMALDKQRAEHPYLTELALKYYADNKIKELFDKKLSFKEDDETENEAAKGKRRKEVIMCNRMFCLGIQCISKKPEHRPEMEHVLNVLSNIDYDYNTPK